MWEFFGFLVSSLFFGSFLTTLITICFLFPLEQFCFGLRFICGNISLGFVFCPNLQLPLVLSYETVPSSICFRFLTSCFCLLVFSVFQGIFSFTFPLDFSLCFIPSDGKPGSESQLGFPCISLLLIEVEPFRFYLYIGITSCDYKISQTFLFFNM